MAIIWSFLHMQDQTKPLHCNLIENINRSHYIAISLKTSISYPALLQIWKHQCTIEHVQKKIVLCSRLWKHCRKVPHFGFYTSAFGACTYIRKLKIFCSFFFSIFPRLNVHALIPSINRACTIKEGARQCEGIGYKFEVIWKTK